MDNITKGIIICVIIFYLTSSKMISSSQKFSKINGEKFSILDLEFPKSKAVVQQLIKDFATGTKENVIKNLNDDYIFMIGAYVGIALMCLKARDYTGGYWPNILICIAGLQILPWIFDVIENIKIRKWVDGGEVDEKLGWFKFMVGAKFFIASIGALLAIFIFLTSGWCVWHL